MRKIAILLGFVGVSILFSANQAQAANLPLTNPPVPTFLSFQDGNTYNPSTGNWLCLFLMDGNCYDLKQNVLATRPITTPVQQTFIPTPPPPVVTVPVYVQPTEDTVVQVSPPAPVPQSSPLPSPTPSPTASTLKPAYTENELLQKLYNDTRPDSMGHKIAFVPQWVWPFTYDITGPTSVTMGWHGDYYNYIKCKAIFNGQTINGGSQAIFNDLTPGGSYSYQVIYSEPGREDTVINKSFNTPMH